ncbi:MAG: ATP-binding cassette domain-containing protein [Gemmataceae bacterium]
MSVSPEVILEAHDLARCYRARPTEVWALRDLSLRIERGSLVVVGGPSGSGKTTLLALLGGLDRPTQGQVKFAGIDLATCSSHALARCRQRMGWVFQSPALIPGLSALDNVVYPLVPREWTASERRSRASEQLERLGLQGRLEFAVQQLSGGEQRRVAIARALAGGPELLLMDEPTANLDRVSIQLLFEVIAECRSRGTAVVLSSHDPAVLTLEATRVELHTGRMRLLD